MTSALPHRPRLLAGVATTLSTALAGFGLSVLALGSTGDLIGADAGVRPAVDTVTARATPAEARLMRRFHCSTSGLPTGTVPGSSLVREPDGRVHAVSFDRGWRIYRQHGARTLVAVCVRPLR